MERRMLLAVVLSIVCVTAYSAITGQGCVPRPPKKDEVPRENGDDPNGANLPNNGDPAPKNPDPKDPDPKDPDPKNPNPEKPNPDKPGPAKPNPEDAHPHANTKRTNVVRESAELRVEFDSRGGGIRHIQLKNHREGSEGPLLDLTVPADLEHLLGQTDLAGAKPGVSPGGAGRRDIPAGPMRAYNWTRNEDLEATTPEDDVVFEFKTRDGATVRKRWWLVNEKDRYDIKLAWSAMGGDGPLQMRLLTAAGQFVEPRKGMDMFGAKQAVVLTSTMDELEDSADFANGWGIEAFSSEGVNTSSLRLLGSRSLYFTTLLYSDGGNDKQSPRWAWVTGEDSSKRLDMEKALISFFEAQDRPAKDSAGDITELGLRIERSVANMQYAWATFDVATDANATPIELTWYAGPLDRETLAQAGYEPIQRIITYPWAPDLVAKILLAIYDFFRGLFGSVGLAVILMTLVVRGLMMPISIRNQLSMRSYSRKIQKVKPKLKIIQEKWAKNPKKLREEQMKLYRENNIGFPGGCLMMLIQIPIWFALFAALRREFTVRGASFLWIGDLSGPDMLIDFGGCFTLLVLQICSLNLLPFLMVTLSILHARSMPKPQDEQTAQQYKMMKWMPIIFAVILYNYTAALMLYMTLSSGFGILESKIVRAKDEAAAEAAS